MRESGSLTAGPAGEILRRCPEHPRRGLENGLSLPLFHWGQQEYSSKDNQPLIH